MRAIGRFGFATLSAPHRLPVAPVRLLTPVGAFGPGEQEFESYVDFICHMPWNCKPQPATECCGTTSAVVATTPQGRMHCER